MLEDGVYGLSFKAAPGADCSADEAGGDALLMLRAGTVLGSDRFGGTFRGRYHYDLEMGAALVELRLAVPPHGVLVTGYAAGPEGAFLDIRASFDPARSVTSTVVDVVGCPVAVELRYMGAIR